MNEITVPRLGWSMEEGMFIGWLKKDGEPVRAGEPLFALENEKAAQDVEAGDSGILRIPSDAPKPGSMVKVGAVLAYLLQEGETIPQPKPSLLQSSNSPLALETEKAPIQSSILQSAPKSVFENVGQASSLPVHGASPPRVSGGRMPPELADKMFAPHFQTGSKVPSAEPVPRRIAISPRAMRRAMELEVDWKNLRGTGRTGRIRERDVLAATVGAASEKTAPPQSTSETPLLGHLVPLSPMRRTIARRMSEGVHQAAPVTLITRADATHLVRQREALKTAAANSPNAAPTLTDILAKLTAAALQQHPLLNAQWRDNGLFIPDEINIAIAVDTEDGLLAPVVRDVARITIEQVAAVSRSLVEQARARRLAPEQLQGGTFTITNLGSLGIDAFTPILNLPQCAVLGVGCIRRELVAVGAEVAIREMFTLSLTFDHRIVDGAPAARFLQTLRAFIESPAPHVTPVS